MPRARDTSASSGSSWRDDLETFFQISEDLLFCTATADFRFHHVSPSWVEVLGWTVEELRTRPFLDFCHPDDVEPTMSQARGMFEQGLAAIRFENRYRHKDGHYLWLSWMGQVHEGKIYAVARDVTDVKQQQQALEAANTELERFAYVASHDLKAPLRDIQNLATWLTEDLSDLPEESRRHLETMRGRVSRMEKLLDDLLAYSRAGRLHAKPERFSIKDLFDGIRGILPANEGIDISLPSDTAVLHVPRPPLEIVLRNIIVNAIKHHDRLVGRVDVSARIGERHVEFRVEDDGPGIPEAFQTRVFEMFQTLRPRDEVEGSGVGLALAKKLVRVHGGTISVDSQGSRGTTFTFTWPKTWSPPQTVPR